MEYRFSFYEGSGFGDALRGGRFLDLFLFGDVISLMLCRRFLRLLVVGRWVNVFRVFFYCFCSFLGICDYFRVKIFFKRI